MLRSAPAALRNREAILAILKRVLPPAGFLLEVASGTGEHAAYMAPELPGWTWQPTVAEIIEMPANNLVFRRQDAEALRTGRDERALPELRRP